MGEAAVADEGLEPMPPFEELAPAAGPGHRTSSSKCGICVHFVSVQMLEDEEHGPMFELKCHPSFHRDGRLKKGWIVVIFLFSDSCPMRCHLGLL